LIGLFLVLDLGWWNQPWIFHWNYKEKYETAGLNPIVRSLAEKPYEHRVAILPEWICPAFQVPDQVAQLEERLDHGLYGLEWKQHLFLYYNIQCLDLIQRPRTPEDEAAYEGALAVRSGETLPNATRRWELTNTRYLLGFAGFLDLLNTQFDPGHARFRIVERFNIVPKPEIANPTQWQDMTAGVSTNGSYALFEFTGALPRAKLYSHWQVNTNDQETLKQLASPAFDPARTVLISSAVPASTNSAETIGTVDYTSYAPKHIQLRTKSDSPSVLLLNDKYDPNWQVSVDGQPAQLLRCNFIMRGVYLAPGPHTVEFVFKPSIKPLYVTLTAEFLGVLLLGYLGFARKP
jgi:hypothetical protein